MKEERKRYKRGEREMKEERERDQGGGIGGGEEG